MKKICLLTISLILLGCQNTSLAVNNGYLKNVNKIEKYLISENAFPIYQNYVIFSKKPVKKITSSDYSIVNSYVMTTIDNVRDTIIIEARSLGSAKLSVIVDNQNLVINVTVKKDKTIVETDSDLFEVISLDVPNEISHMEGI